MLFWLSQIYTLNKYLRKCPIKVQILSTLGKQCFKLYVYTLKSSKKMVFWSTSIISGHYSVTVKLLKQKGLGNNKAHQHADV